jgi:hypothetical protein
VCVAARRDWRSLKRATLIEPTCCSSGSPMRLPRTIACRHGCTAGSEQEAPTSEHGRRPGDSCGGRGSAALRPRHASDSPVTERKGHGLACTGLNLHYPARQPSRSSSSGTRGSESLSCRTAGSRRDGNKWTPNPCQRSSRPPGDRDGTSSRYHTYGSPAATRRELGQRVLGLRRSPPTSS